MIEIEILFDTIKLSNTATVHEEIKHALCTEGKHEITFEGYAYGTYNTTSPRLFFTHVRTEMTSPSQCISTNEYKEGKIILELNTGIKYEEMAAQLSSLIHHFELGAVHSYHVIESNVWFLYKETVDANFWSNMITRYFDLKGELTTLAENANVRQKQMEFADALREKFESLQQPTILCRSQCLDALERVYDFLSNPSKQLVQQIYCFTCLRSQRTLLLPRPTFSSQIRMCTMHYYS